MVIAKKGKIGSSTLIVSMDIIGFALIFVGAAMVRLSKEEVMAIAGGFVLAGGVAVLSITRYLSK